MWKEGPGLAPAPSVRRGRSLDTSRKLPGPGWCQDLICRVGREGRGRFVQPWTKSNGIAASTLLLQCTKWISSASKPSTSILTGHEVWQFVY